MESWKSMNEMTQEWIKDQETSIEHRGKVYIGISQLMSNVNIT